MPLRTNLQRKNIGRIIVALAAAIIILLLDGCYYMQAASGHFSVMNHRRPVAEVIADEESPEALINRLAIVQQARDFAVSDLLLPDNDSYRTYADLERDYVVWNVIAAEEFSFTAKTWCYPVAGCVAYRGYFSEKSARKLGDKLSAKGYDVTVGGVSAYSTLGKFADPLLNTMMRWSDADLVATMFHELAHQKLYIKDDTAFNESFATAVASFGIERWLAEIDELDALGAYQERKVLRRSMMALVQDTRERLITLYEEDIDDDAKRMRKRTLLDELSVRAGLMVEKSGTGSGNWLAAPVNNARLVSLGLYEGQFRAFDQILQNCAADLACFYSETEKLAAMPTADRWDALESLDSPNNATTN
ncbi:MAG: aminopeptidase [Gammaproteobacteria bacterium]|nr:MAG: aminopeptidase [Gammaproteobacteria bacterium]